MGWDASVNLVVTKIDPWEVRAFPSKICDSQLAKINWDARASATKGGSMCGK